MAKDAAATILFKDLWAAGDTVTWFEKSTQDIIRHYFQIFLHTSIIFHLP
jgi:hypothetical protein